MKEKFYKFKGVKHSVLVKIIKDNKYEPYNQIWLENVSYPGITYTIKSMDELEEVK